MKVLVCLAESAGEVATRERLEEEVWRGMVVSYDALSHTITKLRKAFDDDPNHPQIIETIPKVGYRLIAEVSYPSPVSEFAVGGERPESRTAGTPAARAQPPGRRRVAGAAALVALATAVALLAWFKPWQPGEEPVSMGHHVLPLPDKPSIAVLPFTNLSDDREQEYFSDGMTDDLITGLSKVSGLFVISRNSTFTYKGKPMKVKQVAKELGVRYVLEGSVRRVGDHVRINAQLVDATTGGHLWAERYDGTLEDVFALQDKVTQNVVNALAVRLTAEERQAQSRAQTDSGEAYQAFLRGRQQLELRTKDSYPKAIAKFEKALELDPNYSRVYGALAEVYWHVWSDTYSTELGMSREETFRKMKHYLAEAMKNPTAQAQHIRSRYLTSQGRFEEAVAVAVQIIALDPSDAAGYVALGRAANKVGRPAQGLDAMTKGRRLNPRGDDAGAYAYRIGESLFLLGRYEEAEAEFLEMRKRSGDEYWPNLLLAGIYGQLGRNQEAKAALDKFNEVRAKIGNCPHTLAAFNGWTFVPSVRKHYVESLRKAGMPQGSVSPPPEFRGDLKVANEIEGAKTIDAAEAKVLLDRGITFLDVSHGYSWKAGHIPRAVHLRLWNDITEAKLSEIVAKDGEIVIYAYGLGSGRATKAVATAVFMGFQKVYFFREGLPGWKAAGYPVEVPSG